MGPNYRAMVGELELSKDGKVLRTMKPEKRAYLTSTMPMTEAAIDTGLLRDVYVSLGEPIGERAWSVRVYYKPFVELDLGRLPADGAGRPRRHQRPPLPPEEGRRSSRPCREPPHDVSPFPRRVRGSPCLHGPRLPRCPLGGPADAA